MEAFLGFPERKETGREVLSLWGVAGRMKTYSLMKPFLLNTSCPPPNFQLETRGVLLWCDYNYLIRVNSRLAL